MYVFRRIDSALFDYLFQPICNSLANVATPKQIGLFFLMGNVVAGFVDLGFTFHTGGSVAKLTLDFIGPAIGVSLYRSTANAPDASSRMGNPLRMEWFGVRFFCLVGEPFFLVPYLIKLRIAGVYEVADLIGSIAFLAYIYFIACNKPPPREHKTSAWQAGWRAAKVGA